VAFVVESKLVQLGSPSARLKLSDTVGESSHPLAVAHRAVSGKQDLRICSNGVESASINHNTKLWGSGEG
jgi:hypothetical protein